MKKVLLLTLLVVMGLSMLFAADLPKCEAPAIITAVGQSQDANFVFLLGKRLKMTNLYATAITAEDADWNTYKTLICVIGGSGKGLGSAGLDVPSEVARATALIASAKAAGVKIVAMHIGGEDRRGPNSVPFLDFAKEGDMIIVKEDGNQDNYFTKLASDNNIPFASITTTTEIQGLLKDIFF